MAAASSSTQRLRDAFSHFFHAVATARQSAGTAALQRELRMQAFPEDRVMERFIERGVSLETTVQESLTWIELLPEAQGLHDEWVEYKRRLSSYPAVRQFFRGHGHDRLYADRCYAQITYVMLDDNRYWRATMPYPPTIPPTLERLSHAIFDLDVKEAKRRRTTTPVAPPTASSATEDQIDYGALLTECNSALDKSAMQWREHIAEHHKEKNAHSRKFDAVYAEIKAAAERIDEAQVGIVQLVVRGRDASGVTHAFTDAVLKQALELLGMIPIEGTLNETVTKVARFMATGPPLVFVEPVVDEHAFRHVRQQAFEKEARPLVAQCLLRAKNHFLAARGMTLSAKSTAIFQSMAEKADSVATTLMTPQDYAWPAAFRSAYEEHVQTDAWSLVRELWTRQIEPESHPAPARNFDAYRIEGIKARLEAQKARLRAAAVDPQLRKRAKSLSVVFLARFTDSDTEADPARLRVHDVQMTPVQTFLHDFVVSLQTNILPSLRNGQAKSVANFTVQHPPRPLDALPSLSGGGTWTVQMQAFRELRAVMLDLAKTQLPSRGGGDDDTKQLIEVLRLESLADAPTFEIVWSAVARLWVLLLTHSSQ